MPKRRLFIASLVTAALLLLGSALPGSPFVDCAFGFFGCGQGSNECGYDCPGSMNCVPSGNPFDECECTGGECDTIECTVG